MAYACGGHCLSLANLGFPDKRIALIDWWPYVAKNACISNFYLLPDLQKVKNIFCSSSPHKGLRSMRLYLSVAVALLCVVTKVSYSEESSPLFGNDESAIIKYLDDHPIPDLPYANLTGAPTANDPQYIKEVEIAQALFSAGSPAMRLAIARAVATANTMRWYTSWKECRENDTTAKLYLTGLAMIGSTLQERMEVIDWMIEQRIDKIDVSCLIKNLSNYSLYQNIDSARVVKLCEFFAGLTGMQSISEGWDAQALKAWQLKVAPRVGVVVIELFPISVAGNEYATLGAAAVRKWATQEEKAILDRELRARAETSLEH